MPNKSVPLVPVVVEARGRRGWESQASQPVTAFNDQVTVDEAAGGILAGGDGIPEIVIRLVLEDNLQTGDSQTSPMANGWLATIGGTDRADERIARQFLVGISPADLAPWGGELRVDGSVRLREQEGALDELVLQAKQAMGRKRVWLLGTQDSDGALAVYNAAAGWLMSAEREGAALVLKVQPCQLATDTVVVSESAPPNVWLGKLILAR
jgi:hypothetical protein